MTEYKALRGQGFLLYCCWQIMGTKIFVDWNKREWLRRRWLIVIGWWEKAYRGSTLSWDFNNKKLGVWTYGGREKRCKGPEKINLVDLRSRRKGFLIAKFKWLLNFHPIWLSCDISYYPFLPSVLACLASPLLYGSPSLFSS